MIYLHERQEKTKKWMGPRPGFPKPDLSSNMRHMMMEYFVARQLPYWLAKDNGWYPAYYKDAARIIIPCSNSTGVSYFQARDMTGKAKLRYASPPTSRQDSIVIVWPVVGIMVKGTVIVEGPMDALAAAEFNYIGIALMGNDPPDIVIERIVATVKDKFEPVIVIPDLDHLEMGAAVVGALTMERIKCEVRLFATSGGKDLADMTPHQRQEVLCV